MNDPYRTNALSQQTPEDVFAACVPLLRALSTNDRTRVLQALEVFLRGEKEINS